jgi:hypothetical protein
MGTDLVVLPDEERPSAGRESFSDLLARLSRLSVTKHYDAYADVPCDEPGQRIDDEDPVWQLHSDHPLGATAWYQAAPARTRARIGLHLVVSAMQTGVYFENVLTRGLLDFAMTLPPSSPEFRYAYHEVIEESQHTLMFREFVLRSGLDPGGLGRFERAAGRRVVRAARRFPELFFMFVLGGEDPIDHVQRTMLRSRHEVHPLLRRMMQIHITEEARHLCFARAYLRDRVPSLGRRRRLILSIAAPLVLGTMARRMLDPPPVLARIYRIPPAVLAEAFQKSPIHRTNVRESLEKVRALCRELDLLAAPSRPIWRALGIA